MVAVDIFVKARSDGETLQAFAESVVAVLGLAGLEERESSNYEHGHYFLAKLVTAEVELSYLDTTGFEEWQFLLTIEPAVAAQAGEAAESLTKAGFQCFVPEGAWYRTAWIRKGVSYGI